MTLQSISTLKQRKNAVFSLQLMLEPAVHQISMVSSKETRLGGKKKIFLNNSVLNFLSTRFLNRFYKV